ncbi:MAG: AmmeMemoRadiSam system protein A [Candidatus Nealsonbacteria bacterium]
MNPYVSLAKEAVESYIRENKAISPSKNLPQEFKKKAGVFVTIMQGKALKGCIGTYLPTQDNIAEEIIQNAIAAATEDYRFDPIQEQDLDFLNYSVYILEAPVIIKDRNELNPRKFGIIVKTAKKSGLLLPDLEGVDTIDQQLSIACQKGDINPEKEHVAIYKFIAEKYEED